jgi:hypothetical protein
MVATAVTRRTKTLPVAAAVRRRIVGRRADYPPAYAGGYQLFPVFPVAAAITRRMKNRIPLAFKAAGLRRRLRGGDWIIRRLTPAAAGWGLDHPPAYAGGYSRLGWLRLVG